MLKMLFKDVFKFTNEEAISGYVKYLGIQMRVRETNAWKTTKGK